jgi:hypothetical protein
MSVLPLALVHQRLLHALHTSAGSAHSPPDTHASTVQLYPSNRVWTMGAATRS